MDCRPVREILSAYYDGQLAEAERSAVDEHLKGCTSCGAQLDGFRRLSEFVRTAPHADAPSGLWPELQARLDAGRTVGLALPSRSWWVTPGWAFAAAALMLIGLLGWWGYGGGHMGADEERLAADFSRYVDTFARDAASAQEYLLARYAATPLDPLNLSQAVNRPHGSAVARRLPPDYTLVSAHAWDMPCCQCVQLICQRPDGSALAVFEHEQPQPGWLRGRESVADRCGGQECRIVRIGQQQLAATWQIGGRQVTVIGARDMAEVEMLLNALGAESSA